MCARDKAGEAVRPVEPLPQRKALADGKTSRLLQYYRLKQKHSVLRGTAPKPPVRYTPDWLAIMTARSKICLDLMIDFFSKFEKSAPKRMLPNFKKLTHLIIPLALSVIVSSLAAKQFSSVPEQRNKIWILFYLISFAIHFGAQIWMTFVSGLVLYFSLERHVFGQVQERLFPFFYMFNAIMSSIQILSYINTQPTIALDSRPMVQVAVMTLSLVIELFIRLYIAHQIVLLKHKKTRIEAEAGTGREIGQHILGELANCPHYMGILRRFRRLHSYTSIATIVTVICSAYHINYLTDKLCI